MNLTKKIELQTNISLAPFTTLKIGGEARFFVKAENERQAAGAVIYAKENDLDLFVLGGGSNILVSDNGFDGLVLQVALTGISKSPESGVQSSGLKNDSDLEPGTGKPELVTAQAGEDWDGFAAYCVGRNLAGIECLSGIPGFVGGTPVQNVGAYGQEVSQTIVSVKCLDRVSGETVELTNADCRFSYRTSIFNSTMRDRFIVLAVTFALTYRGWPKVEYPELKKEIDRSIIARWRDDSGIKIPFLGEVREAVLRIRQRKSMVIDADDPNSRSAGSFFKNPIVGRSKLAEIDFENVPHFPVDKETVKIPAAWLIENAGFYKGFKLGNAAISTNHSLAIVNLGGATAMEVLALKEKIQAEVERQFGIVLQLEPILVGF